MKLVAVLPTLSSGLQEPAWAVWSRAPFLPVMRTIEGLASSRGSVSKVDCLSYEVRNMLFVSKSPPDNDGNVIKPMAAIRSRLREDGMAHPRRVFSRLADKFDRSVNLRGLHLSTAEDREKDASGKSCVRQ